MNAKKIDRPCVTKKDGKEARLLIKCPKNTVKGYIRVVGKKFKGFEFGRRKVLKRRRTRWG